MKKNRVRVMAAAICLAMAASSTAFAAELPKDVKLGSAALQQAVSALMDAEAITGDTDGLFHAETNLTRAQVCTILVKAINPEAKELSGTATVGVADSGFSDLRGYGWAANYINYAANNGIALGYTDGTFKPGNDVTVAELVTFAVRACGVNDKELGGTWPGNYMAKAEELKLLTTPANVGILVTGNKATKGQAAMIIYNALDDIKNAQAAAAAGKGETPQGTDKDQAAIIPNLGSFVYADGAFNGDINAYDGKTLDKNVTVYVYGNKKDYSKDMTFSDQAGDYRVTTVDKYKSVRTPVWYQTTDGKISAIIVPGDVGFKGKIYCVVTGVNNNVLNYAGERVTGLKTLTAAREIMWLGQKNLAGLPLYSEYTAGEVYELTAKDGEITNVAKASEQDKVQGKLFQELAPQASGAFNQVTDYSDGLINLGGTWYSVRSNASIYVLEDGEYRAGRLSDIKKDGMVRVYDISDDDEASVDIAIVSK